MSVVRTDEETARQIKALARLRGISEEEMATEVIEEYGATHAEELRIQAKKIAAGPPTKRAMRTLKAICTPGGAAMLHQIFSA